MEPVCLKISPPSIFIPEFKLVVYPCVVAAHVAHVAIDTSEGQGIWKNLVKPQVSSGIISRIGDDYSPG